MKKIIREYIWLVLFLLTILAVILVQVQNVERINNLNCDTQIVERR